MVHNSITEKNILLFLIWIFFYTISYCVLIFHLHPVWKYFFVIFIYTSSHRFLIHFYKVIISPRSHSANLWPWLTLCQDVTVTLCVICQVLRRWLWQESLLPCVSLKQNSLITSISSRAQERSASLLYNNNNNNNGLFGINTMNGIE